MGLWTIQEIWNCGSNAGLCDEPEEALRMLTSAAEWCRSYLCDPHPELGRPGVVCPWTPRSMDAQNFWMTVRSAKDDLDQALLGLKEEWSNLEPRSGPQASLKTIVTVITDLDTPFGAYFDERLERLKSTFVESGLMLGEFYPGCPQSGIRNPHFRALESPVPLMAIRDMVLTDLVFLCNEREYCRAYVRKFGKPGCDYMLNLASTAGSRLPADNIAMLVDTASQFDPSRRVAKYESIDSRAARSEEP